MPCLCETQNTYVKIRITLIQFAIVVHIFFMIAKKEECLDGHMFSQHHLSYAEVLTNQFLEMSLNVSSLIKLQLIVHQTNPAKLTHNVLALSVCVVSTEHHKYLSKQYELGSILPSFLVLGHPKFKSTI